MIFSCSRRTDIPYFYHEWFYDKLIKNEIGIVNPYSQQTLKYPLTNDDVIVFWTKDTSNFNKCLDYMLSNNYKFYIQHTLNNYEDYLEKNVKSLDNRIDSFKKLSEKIGKDKVIWRYDPIIITNVHTVEWHKENFDKLISELSKYTSKCVVSILDNYSKITPNLSKIEQEYQIQFIDILKEEHHSKLEELAKFIQEKCFEHDIILESCAENNLSQFGIKQGACVDGNLINQLFYDKTNTLIKHKKDSGQRKECGCMKSIDVGVYDSCLFNCIYCYANTSNEVQRTKKFKTQQINSLTLF